MAMPKLQSTAKARELFNGSKPKGPSVKEQLHAQQHRRAHAVIEWLRDNWDGETIVLPLPVNILGRGQYMHWSAVKELKHQYYSHCELIAMARPRIMPVPPEQAPEQWRVKVHFYGAGVTDEDNARAMMKHLNDWLNNAGWMIDDAPEYFKIVDFINDVDRRVPRIEFRTVI